MPTSHPTGTSKKAGVKVIKFHEFRHSCVSNLLANSLSVRVVAHWVGDTERMVRDSYSHLLPSEKEVIKDFFDGMNLQGQAGGCESWWVPSFEVALEDFLYCFCEERTGFLTGILVAAFLV